MTRIVLLVLLLGLGVAGCGADEGLDVGIFDQPPDAVGEVREVEGGRILVVPKGDACGMWLSVERARVLDYDVVTGPEALRRGQRVRVWITGPIAESCPAQAEAEAVEVLVEPAPSY